jgi:plastocyanin
MSKQVRRVAVVFGIVAISAPLLTASAARADDHAPKSATVQILGGDDFVRPGFLTNDFRFKQDAVTIRQGGTITFLNKTDEGHTITLVANGDVPKTTAEVDGCSVSTGLCTAVNNVYGLNGPGLPAGVQLDNGVPGDDDAQADADAPDAGAIATTSPALLGALGGAGIPILIEDFDTPSHVNLDGTFTVGDSTLVDTSNAANRFGPGFATQRTIVVTAKPGLYHYICTFHPWMQGTIRVVADS